MKRSVRKMMKAFRVHGTDETIGETTDFYFDDLKWAVRYLVVLGGTWLDQKHFLVSPIAVRWIDWEEDVIHVDLSKAEAESGPDLDTHKPVSRKVEYDFNKYYRYPMYWLGSGLWGEGYRPDSLAHTVEDKIEGEYQGEDAYHLRSTAEVIGYAVRARDEDFGRVHDFVLDENSWALPYLIVDTAKLLPGRKKLIQTSWIEHVSWADRDLFIDYNSSRIRQEPNIRT